MKDYRKYSYWLETCGDDLTPRAPLDGSIDVDVAILGAGFTGLWTAYHLLRREPGLSVAVIEKEIAGFGASGRNGGWAYAGFAVGPSEMTRRHGATAARATALAMISAVDDVEHVAASEGIDADIVRNGALEIARREHQIPKVHGMWKEFDDVGLGDRVVWLDADEARDHVNVPGVLGGVWTKDGLTVQPAKLVRGLARAVERRGGRIYEQTTVLDYSGGDTPVLRTNHGDVRAKRAIVLAGEAYLATLPKTHRHVIPITSNIVITEPLPQPVWDQIGWEGRETLGGFGSDGAYIQRTRDNRIAFGPYRGRYPFLSKITDEIDLDQGVFDHAKRSALNWFPAIEGYQWTNEWGGVLGVPRDQMPTMGFNRRTKVGLAYGYTGEGVAAANLSGRVLTDLITEIESELTTLPMVTHEPKLWEPEPLRYMGVTYVRNSHYKIEEEAERVGHYPEKKTLAQRFYDR